MTDESCCKRCIICPCKKKILGETSGPKAEKAEDIYYLCESEICEDYPELCEFLMLDFSYIPEYLN